MMEDFYYDAFPNDPGAEEALARKARKDAVKKSLRTAANRIGWATVLMIAAWLGCLSVISAVVVILDAAIGHTLSFSIPELYNQYLLLLNEATLAIALAVALVVLLSIPKPKSIDRPFAFSHFLKILLICFGVGYLGNLIGTAFLSFWNIITGNTVGDELETVLGGVHPFMMFLSVVVLAPILEELFFRKLLIDRLRPFGKNVCVFLPAFLFALFHQSATQLLYAFAIGAVLAYFYYETGKYWPVVAIHAIFNWLSGFIPMQFLPKIEGFVREFSMLSLTEAETFEEMGALMRPLLETYGVSLALYALYALLLFAVNITGLILFFVYVGKFFKKKEANMLTFGESAKAVLVNPGMIVCTALLGVLTVVSLFM
ncbi:MAG: CPBP family intramembrane metalloprotease [Clostridia bacterium]|nr:CPBP family intramembrane metalloprotease [Clostridia bacterium]